MRIIQKSWRGQNLEGQSLLRGIPRLRGLHDTITRSQVNIKQGIKVKEDFHAKSIGIYLMTYLTSFSNEHPDAEVILLDIPSRPTIKSKVLNLKLVDRLLWNTMIFIVTNGQRT